MRIPVLLIMSFLVCYAVAAVLNHYAIPAPKIVLFLIPVGLACVRILHREWNRWKPFPRKVPLTMNQLESALRNDLRHIASEGITCRAIAMARNNMRRGNSPDEAYDKAMAFAKGAQIDEHQPAANDSARHSPSAAAA